MATYTITGHAHVEGNGTPLDITGVITMDDDWQGATGAVGEWTYTAQIQSFDLSYGGIRITGNNGRLVTTSGADDMWFTLENQCGKVLNMWSAPFDAHLPEGQSQLPAPDEWHVGPRNQEGAHILVGPLNHDIIYNMTHIRATLAPVLPPSPLICRILQLITPSKCK